MVGPGFRHVWILGPSQFWDPDLDPDAMKSQSLKSVQGTKPGLMKGKVSQFTTNNIWMDGCNNPNYGAHLKLGVYMRSGLEKNGARGGHSPSPNFLFFYFFFKNLSFFFPMTTSLRKNLWVHRIFIFMFEIFLFFGSSLTGLYGPKP